MNGVGDMPNTHDMLTGSKADGTAFTDGMDHTCNNWTSNDMGMAMLGHVRQAGRRELLVEFLAPVGGLQPAGAGPDRRRGAVLLLRG